MADPEPFIGDRVVVRYRLGAATPTDWRGDPDAAVSDVTGILLDDTDPLIVERDGAPASIPRSTIVSIRLLSRQTVRNSEIRDLEVAAAHAWPGIESEVIDGWFVRTGHGISRRANSAVPIEFGARADAATLAAIREWYRFREQPAVLAVPDRLLPPGQPTGLVDLPAVQVLTMDLTDATDDVARQAISHATTPSVEWLRTAFGIESSEDPTHAAVASASAGPTTFVSVGPVHQPLSVGRGAVTEAPNGVAWLGITSLFTTPEARGHGHAATVVAGLLAWGIEQGAQRAYLQARTDNRVAGAWYRRLGFGLHHGYRYVTI